MWQIRWLRRLVRRHTNPIPQQKAINWKGRLAVVYAIVAWNAFGVVCYMLYTGRKDWAKYYGYKSEADEKSPGVQWARALKIENARIVRISGLHVVGENEYKKELDPSTTQEQEIDL